MNICFASDGRYYPTEAQKAEKFEPKWDTWGHFYAFRLLKDSMFDEVRENVHIISTDILNVGDNVVEKSLERYLSVLGVDNSLENQAQEWGNRKCDLFIMLEGLCRCTQQRHSLGCRNPRYPSPDLIPNFWTWLLLKKVNFRARR